MAKKNKDGRAAQASDADIPAVGLREPCPCGSGRRYKACHGRSAADAAAELVRRPFEGLASETDWICLREIVPSATSPLTLAGEYAAKAQGRPVILATVLPMALPGIVRADGQILLGLQTQTGSGDPSRDIADALIRALDTEPGNPVPPSRADVGPRLQDVLDVSVPLDVTVHDDFDFWLDSSADVTGDLQASLERASSSIIPTRKLRSVDAGYWCRVGTKEHLRWAQPHEEETLLTALGRLLARDEAGLGPDTKLIGTFRAHGLLVPVWDLAPGAEADSIEGPVTELKHRLDAALAQAGDLTDQERRARSSLSHRQVTLR
jgi:hypothetical protein